MDAESWCSSMKNEEIEFEKGQDGKDFGYKLYYMVEIVGLVDKFGDYNKHHCYAHILTALKN